MGRGKSTDDGRKSERMLERLMTNSRPTKKMPPKSCDFGGIRYLEEYGLLSKQGICQHLQGFDGHKGGYHYLSLSINDFI